MTQLNSQEKTLFAFPSSALSPARAQVLSDTYRLLAITLLFSAAMAWLAMAIRAPYMGLWMLLPYFALLFMVQIKQNKPSGILWTFAFTGWLGFSMGPIINYYLSQSAGPTLIINALSATGLTFLAASMAGRYKPALMSSLFGLAAIGILIAFVVSLLNVLFFASAAAQVWLSGIFAVLSTLLIAGMTGRIVRGEETNYIAATVLIFVMVWNLFMFFLQFFGNRD